MKPDEPIGDSTPLAAMVKRRSLTVLVSILGLFASSVEAAELVLSVDIPTDLGAVTFLRNDVVDFETSTGYSQRVALSALGDAVGIDAVHIVNDTTLLFSPSVAFEVGGTNYEHHDVVQFDSSSGTYALYQAGGTTGLNLDGNVNVDAVALDGSGDLLLSFDRPVTVGGYRFSAV